MATLPFPMSNNCFENTIAVWSCCKNTRMFVVSCARTRSILSISTSFSVTLEPNSDIPIRLLSFSMSRCSSVQLARDLAHHTVDYLYFLPPILLVHSANYGLLNCRALSRKTRWINSSFESVKWLKSEGNVMNQIEVSMVTLPFLMSNNCFENTIAVWSHCKNTRMLVVNWSVFTCRHKFDDFRHVFSLSRTVDREIIGKVWWKSPDRIHQKCFGCNEDLSTFCPLPPVIYFHSIMQFWHANTTIIIFFVSLLISAVSTWHRSLHFWFTLTT